MRLRMLSEEQTRTIYRAALQILREIGMDVRDADTRKRLFQAGCREGDDEYVLFPDELVDRCLSTISNSFNLWDRNGRIAVDSRGEVPHFAPGLNCITIYDHRTDTHRECLLEDVREAARVCERLPNFDMASGLGNPSDVEPSKQALETVKAILKESVKPLPFIAHDEVEDEEIWNHLADVAGGWAALAEKPFALDLTGPYSPLELGQEACRRLRHAARRRLPVVCYPAMIPGTTGPVTLDGAIAQSSAEILAGLVVHQLEQPGAPVITASAILPMDMRSGGIAYGSPEYMMVGIGAVDLFDDLGVPTWIGAGCSDAHIVDAQAAAEAGMSLYLASLAGTAFIHNLGFLSAGKNGSLEMLVLGDELAGGVKRLAAGIQVSPDTLGVEVTRRAAREHSFIMDEHTIQYMSRAMWEPRLFRRTSMEGWAGSGSAPVQRRIREKLQELLEK
jgi:trimethylamine--corrinoid protein Co-methyltransferase